MWCLGFPCIRKKPPCGGFLLVDLGDGVSHLLEGGQLCSEDFFDQIVFFGVQFSLLDGDALSDDGHHVSWVGFYSGSHVFSPM